MKIKASKKKAPTLEQVMKALGDPVRLAVVKQLLSEDCKEKACGTFDYTVTKATFSHHLKILKEAGITCERLEGTRKLTSLNHDELEKNFPGLIDLISRSS